MKKEWPIITLGEACEDLFAGGDVPKNLHSKSASEKYSIPIFTNGEKNMGLYGYTNKARVTKPSLTISARGTIGYSEIRYEPFFPAVRLIVATPKEDVLDIKYLKYVVNNFDFVHSGTSIPQLTVPMIRQHPLSLPSLMEQKRLVKILDEKFDLIENLKSVAKEQLEITKELFESRLVEIFKNKKGWQESKLSSLCAKITDGSHNPPKGVEISEYLMLSSKNVFNDNINLNSPRYLSEKDFKSENKRTEITEGDVLLTIVGTIGRTAVVSNSDNYYTLQRSVAVLKPAKNIIHSRFLMYVLRSIFDELVTNARGVAQKGLYLNQIRDLKVSVPDIATQSRIVKELDELSKKTKELEDIFGRKIADLEELRKSYLHEAFSGNL